MHKYTKSPSEIPSLQEAFERWLDAPWKEGGRNRDRTETACSNFLRALACLAAATGDGEPDLAKLPASLLQVGDDAIRDRIEQGARLLAARENRRTPSEKTVSNLTSCIRRIQRVALPELGLEQRLSVRQLVAMRGSSPHAGRQGPQRFFFNNLPEAFKRDWEDYRRWKMAPFLPPSERKYRKKVCVERSLATHRRRINTYAGWLHEEKGIAELRLEDLCDPGHYAEYLAWYLERGTGGGYHTAKDTGTTLGTISQYLVAKRRLPELLEGRPIWDEFYEQGEAALKLGAERGELPEKRDPDAFTVKELRALAQKGWATQPVHRGAPHGKWHDVQLVSRKRSALWFRLALEAPLRLRNWRGMRWGEHLYRAPDGRWTVHFKGSELKVRSRGAEVNEYRITFTEDASAWIDRWRAEFKARRGDDFELTCPYVFPPGGLTDRPCCDRTLRTGIRALALEFLGKDFNPHLIRHIVATHVIRTLPGLDGINLAAKLLGNTRNVVMKTYASENADAAHDAYLEKLLGEDEDDEGQE